MRPHITIVTGTYNRITTLQRLVKSVRENMLEPVRYEYIIVDNGSTDDTPEWVQSQDDLTLIQLGKPMGAIHAFTEGAYKANAPYVLFATDDIVFPRGSILKAYSHLTSHLTCGAVTFAHNKNRNEYKADWHPVRTESGAKTGYPYPQIALIRKWLGDECDWWGGRTGMKNAFTYGGDNWLGAQIIERGYSVDVVPGAVNNESYLLDEPRKLNQRNHQRDAELYFNQFPNFPTLRTAPTIPQQNDELLRVVFVAHWLNKRSKREKRALISAWERVATVIEVDYANLEHPDVFMQEIVDNFQPHLVFSQIHNSNIITPSMVQKIRIGSPETVWINWVGDYWPDKIYRPGVDLWKQFDALLPVNMDILEEMSQYTRTFPYLNTYEEPDENELPEVESYDVVFLGNAYSQARWEIWKLLDSLRSKYKVGLFGKVYGSFQEIKSDGVNHYDYAEGRAIYKKAKLAISTNEFGAKGYTSNRYFETISAGGALCLHENTPEFEHYIGSKNGTHYIQWDNLAHLEQLIDYWLKPEQSIRRRQIARNAKRHAESHHSADARVKYVLTEIVPQLAGGENGNN